MSGLFSFPRLPPGPCQKLFEPVAAATPTRAGCILPRDQVVLPDDSGLRNLNLMDTSFASAKLRPRSGAQAFPRGFAARQPLELANPCPMNQNPEHKKRLHGKVAVVTGATGGIGEATAKLFLQEGASVMLVARSAEKLKETCSRLAVGQGLAQFVADAADEIAMAAGIDATVRTFGGVDILFANAGTEGKCAPIEAQQRKDFEEVLRTNVVGVWLAMKYCVGPMKQRGGGSMLAVASMAGVVGFAGVAPYIASKHAVCGLVKSAALELGPSGIRVNAIAPGPIDNRMIRSLESQVSPEDPGSVREGMKAMIPLKRYGTNEEVACLAVFLASDEASYCTGGIHMIDGGYTAG